MADLMLADGVRVTIKGPAVPRFTMAPPATGVTVLPVRGPAGPPGGAGYTHHQATPAASWVIHHNQNRVVTPTIVLDTGGFGEVVYTDVEILDLDTITLDFPAPVTGYAYL